MIYIQLGIDFLFLSGYNVYTHYISRVTKIKDGINYIVFYVSNYR